MKKYLLQLCCIAAFALATVWAFVAAFERQADIEQRNATQREFDEAFVGTRDGVDFYAFTVTAKRLQQ